MMRSLPSTRSGSKITLQKPARQGMNPPGYHALPADFRCLTVIRRRIRPLSQARRSRCVRKSTKARSAALILRDEGQITLTGSSGNP